MPRRRSIHYPEEDFPMTPMIDMVFLLLVFFMTVSTLAQADRHVKLDLPESASSEVPDDLNGRGTISVNENGQIFLGAEKSTLRELKASIKDLLLQTPQLRILLRADQDTPYKAIKKILRTCAEAGAHEVIYATYQLK